MRQIFTVLALACVFLLTGDALAQTAGTDYTLVVPPTDEFTDPFSAVAGHSGARSVTGPYDLDGDDQPEVLVSEYTGGGRVHVIELSESNTWEWVYSTPFQDSTTTSRNGRIAKGADLDGDGLGEIVFICGNFYNEENAARIPMGICIYENTGEDNEYGDNPTYVYDFPDATPDRLIQETMEIIDVDGDGVQEILVPNNGGTGFNQFDSWYVISISGDIGSGFESGVEELRLTTRVEDVDPVDRGGGSAQAMHAADLDGDGTYEISMHSWNYFNFTNADVTGPDTYVAPGPDAPNRNLQATFPEDLDALFGGVAVDINMDGDDEVFYPSRQTFRRQAVSVLNYEPGEDVLQITPDQFILDLIQDPTASVRGLTNLGITAGDVDGDGDPELIGVGWEHVGEDINAGEPPFFVHIADFVGGEGGDPELAENYEITKVATPLENDTSYFDVVYRDSAGVMTKYFDNPTIYFPPKLAYLGDVDDDNMYEVALSFQGVIDSITVFDESYVEAFGDPTFTIDAVEEATDDNDWFLTGDNAMRGGAYNPDTDNLLVVSRTGGLKVYGLDSATGAVVDTLDVTGIEGGTFPLSEIAVTSDGQIFGANLAIGAPSKVYWWADQDATPVVVYDAAIEGPRWGDGLGVEGSGEDVTFYLSGSSNDQIAVFTLEGGALTLDRTLVPQSGLQIARYGIAPVGDGTIWVNQPGSELTLIDAADGSILRQVPGDLVDANFGDLDYFEVGERSFVVTGPRFAPNNNFAVAEVTTPGEERLLFTYDDIGTNSNGNAAGFAAYNDGTVYLGATNNRIVAVPLTIGFERTVREKAPANRTFMRILSLDERSVAIDDRQIDLPGDYQLSANYPNPFNPTTTFSFTLPADQMVSVKVYDVTGRLVRTLVNGEYRTSGVHNVTWNGTNDAGQSVASGTYLYTLEWGTVRQTRAMVLLK